MATITYQREPAQTLYASSGYYGGDPIVGSTEQFSATVNLAADSYYGLIIYVFATFPPAPTDDLEFYVYGQMGGGFAGNEVPMVAGSIEKLDGAEKRSQPIFIEGVNEARVGVKSSGTTDVIDVKVVAVPYMFQSN